MAREPASHADVIMVKQGLSICLDSLTWIAVYGTRAKHCRRNTQQRDPSWQRVLRVHWTRQALTFVSKDTCSTCPLPPVLVGSWTLVLIEQDDTIRRPS